VLAPCAGWRNHVVPGGRSAEAGDTGRPPDREAAEPSTAAVTGRPLRRYAWADLLRRVFAVDVLECPDCGGPMRILAAIHPPKASRAILECLGLPSRLPPPFDPTPSPQSSRPPTN